MYLEFYYIARRLSVYIFLKLQNILEFNKLVIIIIFTDDINPKGIYTNKKKTRSYQ